MRDYVVCAEYGYFDDGQALAQLDDFTPREQIRVGTPLRTQIDLSQMSVFDRETRKRL